MKIPIGIADDHKLFLKSLTLLINSFKGFEVTIEAVNGKELLSLLQSSSLVPEIILLDVNMPVLSGEPTAIAITEKYPFVHLVALSMKDDDLSVVSMLKAGCCAYLLKEIHPDELERALSEIYSNGYYNGDMFNVNHRRLMIKAFHDERVILNPKEMEFIKLACSDLTYKQIGDLMHLSERTIDGYRETLFGKLNVKSRVGMALEAIKRNWVNP